MFCEIFLAAKRQSDGAACRRSQRGVGSHQPNLSIPRLINGTRQICWLNAPFLVLLRAYMDWCSEFRKDGIPGSEDENKIACHIQKVLESNNAEGTDLTCLKEFLCKRYPGVVQYQREETGGHATVALQHMIKEVEKEIGSDRWSHTRAVTEDKGSPPSCCGQPLLYQTWEKKSDAIFISVDLRRPAATSLQYIVDHWEDKRTKGDGEATCQTCNRVKTIQTVSLPQEMPLYFTVEYTQFTSTITDIMQEITWGGAKYRTVGVIHHREHHFWASVRQPEGQIWVRLDDWCGREDLWRRSYTDSPRGLETSSEDGRTAYRLQDNVGLLLLEKQSVQDADDEQVSPQHFIYVSALFTFNCILGPQCLN